MRARALLLDDNGNPTRLDWPVDVHGTSAVPRVGEFVVTPEGGSWVVHSLHWNPLGDDEDPAPFVVIIGRRPL